MPMVANQQKNGDSQRSRHFYKHKIITFSSIIIPKILTSYLSDYFSYSVVRE